MTHPEAASRTIRSTAGIVWLVVTGGVVLFLLVDVVVRGSATQALLIAPWLLLVVWFAWVFLASPRVTSDAHGVVVRNPLRTTAATWGAVVDITLRWQVTLELAEGRPVQAWALAARRQGRRPVEQPAERELELLRELRSAASPAPGTIRRTWDVPAIVALVVLLVWAGIAVALTR
ncbi:PH domain-containing protein [Microbacterium gilvum]|uniref:Low molecular weight protein antigen 6 PH domain-containing protein n=1 Tax=Microbacterium gilvum TaxID=1336204 RepID=A0ABP8ZVJ6_9MICO